MDETQPGANPNPAPQPQQPTPTPEGDKPGEPGEPQPEKTYTAEEYNRAIQSANSKGKNEILKALGINSIDEGKNLISGKSDLEKDIADLKARFAESERKAQESERKAAVLSKGVDAAHVEDATILAAAKATGDKTFDAALDEVLKANPQFLAAQPAAFGSQKTPSPAKDGLQDTLAKKYPWLKE